MGHAGADQDAHDAPHEGIEQVLKLGHRRCRRTVELRRVIGEGVGAVQYQKGQVNVQIQRRPKALNEGHQPGLGAGAAA